MSGLTHGSDANVIDAVNARALRQVRMLESHGLMHDVLHNLVVTPSQWECYKCECATIDMEEAYVQHN
jgi:hypothetical protein